MPPVLEQKKRESAQRAVPVRKRTKLVDARQMRKSIDATADPKKYLEAQFALKNANSTSRPRSPSVTGGTAEGRPSAFLSPPHSPPAAPAGGLPKIDTGMVHEAKKPSPVDLNAKSPQATTSAVEPPTASAPEAGAPATEAGDSTEDEPFVPPGSAPPAPSVTSPPIHAPSPVLASPAGDTVLASGPASLSRNVSGELSRIRGPRVPAARGPRPLSTAVAATVPISGRASPPRGGMSPRQSFTSTRAGSPGTDARNTRPRTPPDVKDYLPTKRGGRTAAGSFSRARPMGDSSPGNGQ